MSALASRGRPEADDQDSPISTALQSLVEDGRRPLKTSKPGTSMLEPRSPHIGTSGIGDTEVSVSAHFSSSQ